jgi:hypothetical protein
MSSGVRSLLEIAATKGEIAGLWMRSEQDGFLYTAEENAERYAIDAARAAFRAVPALREEA